MLRSDGWLATYKTMCMWMCVCLKLNLTTVVCAQRVPRWNRLICRRFLWLYNNFAAAA